MERAEARAEQPRLTDEVRDFSPPTNVSADHRIPE